MQLSHAYETSTWGHDLDLGLQASLVAAYDGNLQLQTYSTVIFLHHELASITNYHQGNSTMQAPFVFGVSYEIHQKWNETLPTDPVQ